MGILFIIIQQEMNSKTTIACLAIILYMAFSVDSLSLRSHKIQSHRVEMACDKFAHQLYQQLDLPQHLQPKGTMNGLMALAFGDSQILDSIMSDKPLSAAATQKVKNFFLNDPDFLAQMAKNFQNSSNPECIKNLSSDKKKQMVKVMVNEMDFSTILSKKKGEKSQPVDDSTANGVVKKILTHPELGPQILKCMKQNPQFMSKASSV